MKDLRFIPELLKMRITVFVAFSATIGYVMYKPEFSLDLIIANLGVFLLACGASAINHFQEKDTDALMPRTKNRPIPSGEVTPETAFGIGVLLIITGGLFLFMFFGVVASLLGFLAFIWYNIIYTPMKKRNAMAVVPGALIGAIPPVIGWVAAGGEISSPAIISIAVFFFIWQIPHFWILVLLYNEDYKKAGFPTLFDSFTSLQIGRITYSWIAGLAVSSLFIPILNISGSYISISLLAVLSIWLVIITLPILSDNYERIILRKAFLNVNIFVLIVTLIISIDKLVLN